MPNLQLFHILK
jgi:kynureninase